MLPAVRQLLLTPAIPRRGLVCWHDLYDPTASLASVPDLSGHGYALQLGSTTGADSNDPAWAAGGKGLVFTTDYYCLTGNLAGVNLAGPWTWIFALLKNGSVTTGSKYPGGVFVTASNFYGVRQMSATTVEIRCNGGSVGVESSVSTLTVSDTSVELLVMQCVGGTPTLRNMSTGISITGPTKAAAIGAPVISVGALGVTNIMDAMSAYETLFYNRALSNAELARAYRAVRAKWAGRGVTIL